MKTEQILTHRWQEQGLGTAPFRVVCIISLPSPALAEANTSAYNASMAECCQQAKDFGVGLGTCDSCGMALMNNVVIRDADGKHFIVGCDCAQKTGDSKLMSRVEYLEKQRQKAIREAKRQAAWEDRRARQEAECQAQRGRNGGLTDAEVLQREREREAAELRSSMVARNGWLLDVLARVPYESGFVASVVAELETRTVESLSARCLDILAEIYAKTVSGSRKGSKAYQAAEQDFADRLSHTSNVSVGAGI